MNIPAPFRMALPTPPLPPPVPAAPPPLVPPPPAATATNPSLHDISSDESEMESSEVVNNKFPTVIVYKDSTSLQQDYDYFPIFAGRC